MKLKTITVDRDPLKRDMEAGEFVAVVCAAPILMILGIGFPVFQAFGVSALSCAFTISRTLTKSGREMMRHPSHETKEARLLLGAVVVILLLLLNGLPRPLALASIALPVYVFIVCRGFVKKADQKMTMKQSITAL